MNNEFKKLSQGDVTRYVLESGSSGGTSSGSVPMGGMQRRKGDNLIAQEADKNTVPASTPRNFVAKNAKSSGAGAHKDKSKTIPRKEKHKKPFMEDHSTATGGWGQGSYDTYTAGNHGRGVAEDEEYDDEAGMADNNIETMKRAVDGLDNLIHKGDNLPEWCQEKIAVAKSMLVTVWDYMASEEQGVAEGAPELLKQEMPLVRHIEKELAQHGYEKGTPEYDQMFKHTMSMYRKFGNVDAIKRGVAEGSPQSMGTALANALSRVEPGSKLDKKIRHHNDMVRRFGPEAGTMTSAPDGYRIDKKGFVRLGQGVAEEWSQKYKSSINCSHPKGFSQRAHCAGKKKHNESMEMESVCPDCGMCATHGDNMMEVKQRLDAKCWKGKHKEGTKIKGGVRVNNCVPNEDISEVAPKGWEGTVKAMKKHKEIDNPWALAWSMKNKGYKSHKTESSDAYFESLNSMLERQLEPTMDLDTWVDNFQNADPNKYHQFKNKTAEKKK